MRQIALGIVITGLISTSAWADEPLTVRKLTDGALAGVSFVAPAPTTAQDPAEPEKPWTLTVGADIPSDYFFRGFALETEGFIFQPYVDLGLTVSDYVSLNIGFWNSLHSAEATSTYFEADPYLGATFTAGKWSPSVLYTAYTSPNDSFSTIHELAFGIAYDTPLAPSATLAVELNNDGHTYLGLGIEPGIPLENEAVSLSVPVNLGFSLKDYYTEAFGYFSAGLAAGVDVGSGFELHGSFSVLFLGDALKYDDGTVKPVFSIGFSYSY